MHALALLFVCLVLFPSTQPTIGQATVKAATPSPVSASAGTAAHLLPLTDQQVNAAIARGNIQRRTPGLKFVDTQVFPLGTNECSACLIIGYTAKVYTPELWIEQLARNAHRKKQPFTASDVTAAMRQPLLHVEAFRSYAIGSFGPKVPVGPILRKVVLTDTEKRTTVEPVTNEVTSRKGNQSGASIYSGKAICSFQMADVENLLRRNGELLVAVVGDRRTKYFKLKADQLTKLYARN